MPDTTTTIADLREVVRQFVTEREWGVFHSPKNLTMSLAIEAAELMEHFQWLGVDESRHAADAPAVRQAIGEEMADVASYLLALCNVLQLDLSDAVRDKMVKNARKYPAEQFKGRYGPDDSHAVNTTGEGE